MVSASLAVLALEIPHLGFLPHRRGHSSVRPRLPGTHRSRRQHALRQHRLRGIRSARRCLRFFFNRSTAGGCRSLSAACIPGEGEAEPRCRPRLATTALRRQTRSSAGGRGARRGALRALGRPQASEPSARILTAAALPGRREESRRSGCAASTADVACASNVPLQRRMLSTPPRRPPAGPTLPLITAGAKEWSNPVRAFTGAVYRAALPSAAGTPRPRASSAPHRRASASRVRTAIHGHMPHA